MSVDVGSTAPDFTLMNHDRQPVTLSALRGRPVVLAFFPGAFSDTCTSELCTLRDSRSKFTAVNAQVLGISVDTFFTLKAFHDQQQFTFPLLCDFNKQVIRELADHTTQRLIWYLCPPQELLKNLRKVFR